EPFPEDPLGIHLRAARSRDLAELRPHHFRDVPARRQPVQLAPHHGHRLQHALQPLGHLSPHRRRPTRRSPPRLESRRRGRHLRLPLRERQIGFLPAKRAVPAVDDRHVALETTIRCPGVPTLARAYRLTAVPRCGFAGKPKTSSTLTTYISHN